ncbi:MAG: DUF4093 domain-containing protein [Ruminococcus sp.]|nr:DUF4093 domain-containing protein [Ruminococcus sp.]
MEKLKIRQAVVVEGKYDKITLSQIIDAVIITTDGFGLYNDPEKASLIRFYAKTCGIIIMTDSDYAGQQIRGHIKSIVPNGSVINVYVPEIFGKEKRKAAPSKEGKLGVEGMSAEVISKALERAGVTGGVCEKTPVTKTDFIMLGLSGGQGSASLRRQIAAALELPQGLSANALRDAVSVMLGREEFISFFENFVKEHSDD